MFWIKKLNLSHQAWPSRSQPRIGNQEPGVPFLKLLRGKGKQEICSGWGLCRQQHEPSLFLIPHSASQLCVTKHHPGLLPSAQYPMLSGLLLSALHRKSAPRAMALVNMELSPCYSLHQSPSRLIPPHLHFLMWHRYPKPGPYSCSMFLGGEIRVGLRALMKAEKHQIIITCVISPLRYRPVSQQSGPCWTVTSLKVETGFSTSLFPLRKLTQSRCLIIPLKLTENKRVNEQT